MSAALSWIDARFPLSEFVRKHITGYPTPKTLNYWWNLGSLAGFFLVTQVVTGIWLAFFYKPDTALAFDSVQHIMRDVNFGWLIRYMHAAGASGFFLAVYLHMGRAFYYGSYRKPRELLWWIGFALFFSLVIQAFTGYLLPWGDMSFWSATVITDLFGTVPMVGERLVVWLRGDFAVGDPTLGRFFALHTTLFPLGIIGALVLLHLTALHRVGSGNPDGIDLDHRGPAVIPFSPYYIARDLWFASAAFTLYWTAVFFFPSWLLEPVNNMVADPLSTPAHIVPDWYFLPFYAILRSIPSKTGGAAAMAASMFVLLFLPWLDRSPVRSSRYRPVKRVITLLFFADFILLGYLGSRPPLGAVLTAERFAAAAYFIYFALLRLIPSFEKTKPLPREGDL